MNHESSKPTLVQLWSRRPTTNTGPGGGCMRCQDIGKQLAELASGPDMPICDDCTGGTAMPGKEPH